MNTEKYLYRIGISDSELNPDLKNLKILQRQHLLNIVFENLDIHWQKPIILDVEKLYRKIVEQRRGGFCYELNGLFYELLNSLGYQSKLISARVAKENGEFGCDKDHMAILTKIADEEFLVDVGFGSFTAEPLELVTGVLQKDSTGVYKIEKKADEYFLIAKKDGEVFVNEFIFTTEKYELEDFSEMCLFHQTSPESHFTKGKVCSLMTEKGRKTLTDKSFIETVAKERIIKNIDFEEEFNRILKTEFGIEPEINKNNTALI